MNTPLSRKFDLETTDNIYIRHHFKEQMYK